MGTFEEFISGRDLRGRSEYFLDLGNKLLELKRPILIVETGCMRPPHLPGHEWEDGQATLIWDWLARTTEGSAISIDIDSVNCQYAKDRVSDRVNVICGDSIDVLSDRDRSWGDGIDLLYLDSMDWKADDSAASTLHHVGELAAAWRLIRKEGIIAVDDCAGPFAGKHAVARLFLEMFAGLPPFLLGTICAWKKL